MQSHGSAWAHRTGPRQPLGTTLHESRTRPLGRRRSPVGLAPHQGSHDRCRHQPPQPGGQRRAPVPGPLGQYRGRRRARLTPRARDSAVPVVEHHRADSPPRRRARGSVGARRGKCRPSRSQRDGAPRARLTPLRARAARLAGLRTYRRRGRAAGAGWHVGAAHTSMKMHSPGHSSADSMVASS